MNKNPTTRIQFCGRFLWFTNSFNLIKENLEMNDSTINNWLVAKRLVVCILEQLIIDFIIFSIKRRLKEHKYDYDSLWNSAGAKMTILFTRLRSCRLTKVSPNDNDNLRLLS